MIDYKINTILVPVDFSESSDIALEHAVFMARMNKSRLIMLHVIESFSFTSAIGHAMKGTSFEAKAEEMVQNKFNEIVDRIKSKDGIKVETKIKLGRIHHEILRAAKENDVSLIIMGTHGVSGFQEFLVGSNARRIMSTSSCPVLTVQQHSEKIGYKNIVVPIDDSKHSREKINFAIGLTKQYNAKLHVVAYNTDGSEETMKKLKLQIHQLEEIFKNHDIFYSTKIVESTDKVKSILEYCELVKADVMIIMTEQEFDMKGVLLGPAAQRLVNHSKIPVVSIRPHYNPEMIEFHGYGW